MTADTTIGLSEACQRHAQSNPEEIAVVFGDRSWTYAALESDVNACAHALVSAGIKPGDRIVVATTPRPEGLITLLGALRIGALWVGINPKYTVEEMRVIVSDCSPGFAFAARHDGADETLKKALAFENIECPFVPFAGVEADDTAFDDFLAAYRNKIELEYACDLQDPAIIVYTSGTTGKPKGAILPQSAFAHCNDAINPALGQNRDFAMRIIVNLPMNHVGCLTDTIAPTLYAGGLMVFMEEFDPAGIFAEIEKHQLTILGGVPTMLQVLVSLPLWEASNLASLRAIGWGGAAMPEACFETLAAHGAALFTTYGLTEGGSISTTTRPGDNADRLLHSVGRITDDQAIRIVTEQGLPAPAGVEGEIQIRGRGVMLGYFNNEQATRAAFTDDGWLKTGDIGVIDEDGYLALRGRTSEMFKSGGYNVYPREIEAVLERHPNVAVAAVLAVRDDLYGEVGAAFIIPLSNDLDEDQLQAYCRQNLANYKVPKSFLLKDQLPMLPIGKVDRRALAADLSGGAPS